VTLIYLLELDEAAGVVSTFVAKDQAFPVVICLLLAQDLIPARVNQNIRSKKFLVVLAFLKTVESARGARAHRPSKHTHHNRTEPQRDDMSDFELEKCTSYVVLPNWLSSSCSNISSNFAK